MISSLDLEITDLFEEENNGDVASGARHDEGDENEGNANDASTVSTAKVAAKRIIRNPQPKLNPQRLCGDRGIVQLPKIFSEVKLKGKGHEKENLDLVMKTIEHWSHRLFPKFTFDDVLERVEKLGSKKAVQNCVNRIRMDMPVLSEDYVNGDENNIVDSEDENSTPVIDEQLHATIFGPTTINRDSRTDDASSNSANPQVLTDDQLARIERNRRIALERRAARLLEAAQSFPTSTETTTICAEDNSLGTSSDTAFDALPMNKICSMDEDAMQIDVFSTLNDSSGITNTKKKETKIDKLECEVGSKQKDGELVTSSNVQL